MLKNYFKSAWRNLMKDKTFSFINIFGLTVGLTCCLLIALYLYHETTYDAYQDNLKQLYQVGTVFINHGEKDHIAARTPAPMGAAMKFEFPEVIETTKLLGLFADDKTLIQYNQEGQDSKSVYETNGYLTDPSFFRMFTYHFTEGNPSTALNNPNTTVISEEIARKIFGNQPALNKMIHISSSSNGDYDFIIKGVFRPIDQPSHIDARFFMSIQGGDMDKYIKNHATDFASNNMFYTYLLLRPGTDSKKLESRFPAFMRKYAEKDLKELGRQKKQFLIPVEEIHLNAKVAENITPVGSRIYLYILSSIAIFTLLIACINFMNLSTARSSKRSTEVGIRKVLGAERSSLVRQFLGESMLMSFIAVAFAVLFTTILLPYFNEISGRNIKFTFSQNSGMLSGIFFLALLTGFIAGSYPAFYLSSFKPAKVLKGKFANSLSAISLRKILVVFQFVISVILIIATVVIASQMSYMRNADLGFNSDQQLVIPLHSQNSKKLYSSLKNEMKSNPLVLAVGASLYYPGIFNPSDNFFYRKGQTMNEAKDVRMNMVDYDFLKTLNIQPVAGRLFSTQFTADTGRAIIINEETIRQLGFASAQKAVGQKLIFDFHGANYQLDIVGVVKDFHFEDLHLPITPFAFGLGLGDFNYLIIHTTPGNIHPLLTAIQKSWHKLNPSEPLEYSFLNEDFQKNYESYYKLASIITYFTVIAILISCLGLFGLATFSIEQRIKEIGVRKVLGASVSSIVRLVSKDFLRLVTIAILIASPVAWFVMNKWLQDFAFRISISWRIFAITTGVAIFIALATVSLQAIRAAIANPVKNLRSE